jgi:hypothetical protein
LKKIENDFEEKTASKGVSLVIKIKKSGLDSISWNEDRELALLNQVLAQKIHIKTPKLSQASKWILVDAELVKLPCFNGYRVDVISEEALKQKLKNLKKACLKDWSLLKAGSNLSGLPDATRKQELLYNILEYEAKTKNVTAESEAKKDKKDDEMKEIEDFIKTNTRKRIKDETLTDSIDSKISSSSKSETEDENILKELLDGQNKRIKLKEEELAIRKMEAENAQKKIEIDREKVENYRKVREMLFQMLNSFIKKEATHITDV